MFRIRGIQFLVRRYSYSRVAVLPLSMICFCPKAKGVQVQVQGSSCSIRLLCYAPSVPVRTRVRCHLEPCILPGAFVVPVALLVYQLLKLKWGKGSSRCAQHLYSRDDTAPKYKLASASCLMSKLIVHAVGQATVQYNPFYILTTISSTHTDHHTSTHLF